MSMTLRFVVFALLLAVPAVGLGSKELATLPHGRPPLTKGTPATSSLLAVVSACGIVSGACGDGACVGKSYCTGNACKTPICYSPHALASQIMCQGASLPAACLGGASRAMWVWQPATVTQPCAKGKLLQFALARHIDTLYVQSASLLDNPAHWPALADFIDDADTLGITVELLAGEAGWALPADHPRAVQVATEAVAFVASLPLTAAQPTALHYDVEPHQIWAGNEAAVTADYLTMLGNVSAALAGSGLAFHVDIPFHYDNKPAVCSAGPWLHQCVLAAVDGVTVMDYRDTTLQIVNQGQTVVAEGVLQGKPVVVGLMTTAASPAYTTFFEEGPVALEVAMAQTGWPAFAVENYTGYVALVQSFFPGPGLSVPACLYELVEDDLLLDKN